MAIDGKLEIRLPKSLKKEFALACKELDVTQSQTLRKCMRDFVQKYKEGLNQENN